MEISRNMHKQLCRNMLTATLFICVKIVKTKFSKIVNSVINNDLSIGCNI